MNTYLKKAVVIVTTAMTMLSGGYAMAAGVDVNITVPGLYPPVPVYVPPQPTYVQPRTVYVQPRTVYVDRDNHHDDCRDGRCNGKKHKKHKKQKHHKQNKHHDKHDG